MRVLQLPLPAADAPSIDPIEARWAAEAVASLIRQLDAGSPVALCLDQARRELMSLAASGEAAGVVVGPLRVRAA